MYFIQKMNTYLKKVSQCCGFPNLFAETRATEVFEALVPWKEVLTILPTCFGESLIYHLLIKFFEKFATAAHLVL